LPPLRERSEDVPLLAGHLLARHAVRMRRGVTGFTQPALAAMMAYRWPGNIRELDNRIQRGVALTNSGDIEVGTLFGDIDDSGTAIRKATGVGEGSARIPAVAATGVAAAAGLAAKITDKQSIDLEREMVGYERTLVDAALKATDDNLTEAAKLLGISFRQIRYKVRQLGLR
nr:AAA family ATPase [Planctomycetota bacterium]